MAPVLVKVTMVKEEVKVEQKKETVEKDLLTVLAGGDGKEKARFLAAFYEEIHTGKHAKGFGEDEPALVDALLNVALEQGGSWSPDTDSRGRKVRLFDGEGDNWAKFWASRILDKFVENRGIVGMASLVKIRTADVAAVGQERSG